MIKLLLTPKQLWIWSMKPDMAPEQDKAAVWGLCWLHSPMTSVQREGCLSWLVIFCFPTQTGQRPPHYSKNMESWDWYWGAECPEMVLSWGISAAQRLWQLEEAQDLGGQSEWSGHRKVISIFSSIWLVSKDAFVTLLVWRALHMKRRYCKTYTYTTIYVHTCL